MARAATTSDAFNGIAELRRRQIIDLLAGGERPVNDLVRLLRMTQPQVSKHLRILREVGAVEVRDEGRRRVYRLNGYALKSIYDWVKSYERTGSDRFEALHAVLDELKQDEAEQHEISAGQQDGDGNADDGPWSAQLGEVTSILPEEATRGWLPHSLPAYSGLDERVHLENATHATARSMCCMAAEREVEGFIAKFAPEMQSRIRGCRAKLRAQFPIAMELVYDNYNFFVIGFGPTRRPSDAILSLAAHRRGVNLCFLQRGAELPDPTSILRGNGKVVRNVALDSAEDLNRSDVKALIHASLELARTPMEKAEGPSTIIQSVSAKQRPRR